MRLSELFQRLQKDKTQFTKADEDDDGLVEEIPPLQAYGQILEGIASAGVPIFDELGAAEARRGTHLFLLYTHLPFALPAANQLLIHLDDLIGLEGLPAAAAPLYRRSRYDLHTGIEAMMCGDNMGLNDRARDLMEVEALFWDFAAAPDRLNDWASSTDESRRNREYGFGRLRDRRERSHDIPKGYLLPDAKEYKVHSSIAHPNPSGPHGPPYESALDNLVYWSTELIPHHLHRVLLASAAFLESFGVGGVNLTTPELIEMVRLADRFRQSHGEVLPHLELPRMPFHKDDPMWPPLPMQGDQSTPP
jgi:hypothetical protein